MGAPQTVAEKPNSIGRALNRGAVAGAADVVELCWLGSGADHIRWYAPRHKYWVLVFVRPSPTSTTWLGGYR